MACGVKALSSWGCPEFSHGAQRGALVCTLITRLTIQRIPKTAPAPLRGDDPGAIEPGRRVAHMLLVATFQVRYPIQRFVLMKADDLALHGDLYAPDLPDGSQASSTLLLHKGRS